MLRRLFILALVAVVVGLYLPSGALAQEKIKIGILKHSDSAHYVEGVNGILAQLKKEGFDESKVIFDIRSADGDNNKVTAIAKEFKEKGMKLVIAVGTPALIYTYKEIKDIPIVFSQVFDPIGAGVAKSWESSGTSTTGASTWVEMSALVNALRQVSPVKRIGVLYTQEEKNTVIQLEEFKKLKEKMGFSVIEANVAKPEEAGEVTRSLVGKVDAIFIGGGSTLGKGLQAILEVAIKAKIPTSVHLPERAKEGALLAVAGDSFRIGELAGKKVAQVLRGTKPSDIPIEHLKTYDMTINLKTAKAMGITVPVALLKSATKVIKE